MAWFAPVTVEGFEGRDFVTRENFPDDHLRPEHFKEGQSFILEDWRDMTLRLFVVRAGVIIEVAAGGVLAYNRACQRAHKAGQSPPDLRQWLEARTGRLRMCIEVLRERLIEAFPPR